jgi:hypothetical protein
VNRRKYLKCVIAILGFSAGTYSFTKWFYLAEPLCADELLKKKPLLEELVEVIIPTTDTPGAKAAMVHDYIINVILYCTDVRQQIHFNRGLDDVERYSSSEFGKTFLESTIHEKRLVVAHFAARDDSYHLIIRKVKKKLFGEPFYLKLRNLTIEGYCQSRIGATQALKYDSIPGKFLSRVPLTLNQKSWATR